MMNNCWFRVRITPERAPSDQLVSLLHFQHPTSVVPGEHGWMDAPSSSVEKKPETGGRISPSPSPSLAPSHQASLPFYSVSELSLHDKDDDCWH